ncbi:hypothetical protein M9Y10_018998 [Tritrichomonas musculus]|uniref:Uncharacterized protein n=1 Tax=Tritrichomonas musculus TaxID=1915356 RepID=A0ABR2HI92_9EUKA
MFSRIVVYIRVHLYQFVISCYILLLLAVLIIHISFRNSNSFFTFSNDKIESDFPVDLVYTWVDGRDQKWISEFTKAIREKNLKFEKRDVLNRFVDVEELRYSLRSVEKNLPWIRYIFIVTWAHQRPYWIDLNHSKLKFISQSEIFPDNFSLPTFNSKSIDLQIYKIPGLSEHFIYSNDDMYFLNRLKKSDFFTQKGKPIFLVSKNKWSRVRCKHYRFKFNYIRRPNDGVLFMASVTATIVDFINKYGKKMPYCYSHVQIPLTKTLCKEVYSNFKEEIDRTISSRFRSLDDLQMQTLMIQYGAYTESSLVKIKDDHDGIFVVLSENKNLNFRNLYKIKTKKPKLLSINIDDMDSRDAIKAFLDILFDNPSSFELIEKMPAVDAYWKKFWKENYFDDSIWSFFWRYVNNIFNLDTTMKKKNYEELNESNYKHM